MNVNADKNAASFDEGRALEQLEQLHGQILRARAARHRVEAEFDAFVEGFRREKQPHADEVPPAEAPTGRATAQPEAHFHPETDTATLPAVEPANAPQVHAEAADVAPHPAPARGRTARAAVIALSALAIAVAVFAVRGRRVEPPSQTVQPTTQVTKPAEPVATPPPVTEPQTPAAPTGVNLELITRRRVWVRVTIDGRRAFEREIEADQRIPLHGEKTILIRAGDAGAVAVTRDGQDAGVLGRDGMIANREFTVVR